jgi:hypothetical protein
MRWGSTMFVGMGFLAGLDRLKLLVGSANP